ARCNQAIFFLDSIAGEAFLDVPVQKACPILATNLLFSKGDLKLTLARRVLRRKPCLIRKRSSVRLFSRPRRCAPRLFRRYRDRSPPAGHPARRRRQAFRHPTFHGWKW